MTAFAPYVRGFIAECNAEWYHGLLTRVKAEEVLAAFENTDCFLIRECEESLFLSLKIRRLTRYDFHHVKILYGPGSDGGWYKLEGNASGSISNRFSSLNDLVNYHYNHGIGYRVKIMLGSACRKASPSMEYSWQYAEGALGDLRNYYWYCGKITKEKAEATLRNGGQNERLFLVWHSVDNLVLSTSTVGLIKHTRINCSPEGYSLGSSNVKFRTVLGMIRSHLIGFYVKALTPVGNYTDGACTIQLKDHALVISQMSGAEINKWPYNSIRHFVIYAETGKFGFQSGRRGPYGVAEYTFDITEKRLADLLSALDGFTGTQLTKSARLEFTSPNATESRLECSQFQPFSPLSCSSTSFVYSYTKSRHRLLAVQTSPHFNPMERIVESVI